MNNHYVLPDEDIVLLELGFQVAAKGALRRKKREIKWKKDPKKFD